MSGDKKASDEEKQETSDYDEVQSKKNHRYRVLYTIQQDKYDSKLYLTASTKL